MNQTDELRVILVTDMFDEEINLFHDIDIVATWDDISDTILIEERLGVNALATVLMNFDSDSIEDYDEMVYALYGSGSYTLVPKNLDLDLKNRTTPPVCPSIKVPPILELKALPSHLQYAFLGVKNTLLVITTNALI